MMILLLRTMRATRRIARPLLGAPSLAAMCVTRIALFAIPIALCASLVAPRALNAQSTVEQRLLRLTEARVAADFAANRAALDTLLADDLTYARSSGVIDDKTKVLAELGPTGPYALDYLTPDSLRARAYGATGVVTGILHVKLKAQPAAYRIRFTDVWAERRGRWQLVAFQATRLP